MPTPEHNPQSIPPSEIPPGWRLCRESEREKLPEDASYYAFGRLHTASKSAFRTWDCLTYITATPLPESEREVPAASPWIPLSERVPTKDDWDATHGVEYCNPAKPIRLTTYCYTSGVGAWTHWQPVELPPLPPAPAKTQREKDEDAYHKLEGSFMNTHGSYVVPRTAFFHALETERAHFGGRSAEEVKAEIELICRTYKDVFCRGGQISLTEAGPLINNLTADLDRLRALLSPPKEGETP